MQEPQGRGDARAAGARHPHFHPAPPVRSSSPVPQGPPASTANAQTDTQPPRRHKTPPQQPHSPSSTPGRAGGKWPVLRLRVSCSIDRSAHHAERRAIDSRPEGRVRGGAWTVSGRSLRGGVAWDQARAGGAGARAGSNPVPRELARDPVVGPTPWYASLPAAGGSGRPGPRHHPWHTAPIERPLAAAAGCRSSASGLGESGRGGCLLPLGESRRRRHRHLEGSGSSVPSPP